jgi:glycosyltransferase involved in cell wall biosynthesis
VKIFEYMAMGKAIVASGVGQLAELLANRVNALLTQPGDSEEIATAILTLAGDEDLRRRLGTEARATCLAKCTWAHNARRFIQAYFDTLDHGNGNLRNLRHTSAEEKC